MLMVIAFLATFAFTACIGLLVFRRDEVTERLEKLVAPKPKHGGTLLGQLFDVRQASMQSIVRPFQDLLPRSTEEVTVLQKRLIRAGYRDRATVNIFYGCKVLVPIALVVGVTLTGAYKLSPFFVYAVSGAIGFLLPDFWLSNRIASRQQKIRMGLPEALDLMVICTEAGLGMDQTFHRVAEELRRSQPEIRDELQLMNLEQKAGRARQDSLKSFADRVNIDTVRSLTITLIQADNFGTSIAKTLRVYSDTLRSQRRQVAEELAAKTTVKLVFPLVLFIFPSIFVVALGPAIITMMEGFAKFFS